MWGRDTMNPNNSTVDMVLTSIVNNKRVMRAIVEDMNERFNIKVDEEKLEAYLNTVEIDAKPNIIVM